MVGARNLVAVDLLKLDAMTYLFRRMSFPLWARAGVAPDDAAGRDLGDAGGGARPAAADDDWQQHIRVLGETPVSTSATAARTPHEGRSVSGMSLRDLAAAYFAGLTDRDRDRLRLSSWSDRPLSPASFDSLPLRQLLKASEVELYAVDTLDQAAVEVLGGAAAAGQTAGRAALFAPCGGAPTATCNWKSKPTMKR